MAELIEIDGISLRGGHMNVATRSGRYSMPARRGENLVLPGRSGALPVYNRPYESGIGALAVWAVGATPFVATNRVVNPSAETGTASLAPTNGTLSRASTITAYAGTYYFTVTATTNGTMNVYPPTGVSGYPVTPGKTYYAASAVHKLAAPSRTVPLNIYWYTAAGAQISAPQVASASEGSDWTLLTGSAVAPPTAAFATFTTGWSNVVIGEVHAIDGLYFSDQPFESYWDGSFADNEAYDYAWAGTAHASASTRTSTSALQIPATHTLRRQALEDNVATLMRLFTRGHKLSTIRAAQPDGSIRRALVEWKEWDEPEIQAGGTRAEWAIAYEVPGVWWEDESATTQSATAGATLPKTLDLTSFTGMTGIVEDAVLTVPGPITNPRITDPETGAYVQYTGTVANGVSWVVDVAAFTSTVNAISVLSLTTHAGGYRLLTIPNTYNGTNTPRLVLSGSAGGTNTNLTVQARRKWVNG